MTRKTPLVYGALVAVAILFVVNFGLTFRNVRHLSDEAGWVAHTLEVMHKLADALGQLREAAADQLAYQVTSEDALLHSAAAHIDAAKQGVEQIKLLTSDNPQQQARIPLLNQQIDELAHMVSRAAQTPNQSGSEMLRKTEEIRRATMGLAALLKEMEDAEQSLLEVRRPATETAYSVAVSSGLFAAVLGLVALGMFVGLLNRHLRAQHRATTLIHQHRELLHATLASIGDAVIATDVDGRVTFMNQVAESLTHWNENDAKGELLTDVFKIVNEDTRRTVDNPALRALKEGAVVGLANHTILIAKNENECPIDDSAAPIRDAAGAVSGAVLVFRDVTKQRQFVSRIAESEALKTAILDTALDCIITVDHAGKIIDFNPAAEQTFGYSKAEAVGREMAALILPPGSADDYRKGITKYLATGEESIFNRRIELVAFNRSGREFPVEAAITPIKSDHDPLFTIYLRNIADKKQAEFAAAEQLRHAKLDSEIGIALTGADSLQAMLQACAESLVQNLLGAFARIWTLDPPQAVLELQASAGLYTHRDGPHGRVPVGSFKIGMIAQDRKPHLTNSVVGDPRVPEQEWAKKEGLVAFAGYPLLVNDRLVGVMAMFATQALSASTIDAMASAARAIALGIERKEMENKLRQFIADLSEADHRKNEFLATLAHELRNPLAPIRNGLELMRLSNGEQQTVEQARILMERQLAHLVRLVDDLMDISRITRGQIELRRQSIQLADIVSNAVETSRPVIEQMGHELVVDLPETPIVVDGDLTRLTQVFMNILNNAAKYSEPAGKIRLSAEIAENAVLVSIKDNGIGIAADQLPRIFEMFAQVDSALARAQGGLGIGLTLVKRIVEMHTGSIEAKSDGPGKGSEFIVRLPIAPQNPVAAPIVKTDDATSNGAYRILIVDDNEDSANTLAMMLRIMGHHTQAAFDGQAAIDAAAHFQPDIVMLDIGLPKLNGYEACRRIRSQNGNRKMVLIAVTGWGQDEDRRRSHEAGFDYHFVKPVDPKALLQLLAELRT
jgi:PAS domain S-box-containing protein